MVSSSCCSYCYFLLGEVILPLQCGAPSMGDSTLKTVQCGTFPRATALHKLLQQWFSRGYSPSGTVCFSVGSPKGQKSCQQICSCLGFSVHGFPGPARSLLQCRHPMESQLSQNFSGGNSLLLSKIDECSDINCLTLFIFLTKKVKMMNSAPHEAQKSSKNLRESMLKVSSPSQVQVDCQ